MLLEEASKYNIGSVANNLFLTQPTASMKESHVTYSPDN